MSLETAPTGMYQCGMCKAEYARADHLVRHVRSHTKQRPFICAICTKGFGRQDLLKRHRVTHNQDDGNRHPPGQESTTQNGRHSHRVLQACRPCAAKKLKCTEQKPCQRCRERNLSCDADSGSTSIERRGETEANASAPIELHSNLSVGRTEQQGDIDFSQMELPSRSQLEELRSEQQCSSLPTVIAQSSTGLEMPQCAIPQNVMPRNGTPQNGFFQGLFEDAMGFPDINACTDYAADQMAGEFDFAFLNDFDQPSDPAFVVNSPASNHTQKSSTVGIGAEAYRTSNVMKGWEPGQDGRNDSEHSNLILPLKVSPTGPLLVPKVSCLAKKTLSVATRDRILAMLLRTISGTNSDCILASFPSVETLQNLIHRALIHMAKHQVISFIHLPSFDLNQQHPELLCALIAYSSVWSPFPVLRRFGYAVQEATRMAINHRVSLAVLVVNPDQIY